MRVNNNKSAKLKKSDKPLSNALIDDILDTGVFKSPVKENLSSEVKKLLEEF
jgi:hypothetical protein